ncbi:diguanylate cyclase domain-containing protein [Shewanella khirikhana]|uniref:GGDEF domain protein n=1 Tax=Shewanella khirikhana TaxID=1965282 RepID=A0ABN5TRV0_9GAMM|nr:diguanylate cyclase [Shewanella khirikhana]AZQ09963.1 GGDEF domain protein [Shewanella khirikhana]
MIYSFRNSGFRDPETGVYNQTYFLEVFNREWHRHIREQQSLALLYLYPHLRETIKHPGILELFTKEIEGALLRATDLLARMSDDCFALGLFNIDTEGTSVVTERIESAIREFVHKYDKDHSVQMEYKLAACVCSPNREQRIEKLFTNTETIAKLLEQDKGKHSVMEQLQ